MSGTLLNLPRWLLLLLACGVLVGQWHQGTCRVEGSCHVAAVVGCEHSDHDAPDHEEDGSNASECPFQCQFQTAVPGGLAPGVVPATAPLVAVLRERAEPAPESRREAIEHPPQLG